MIYAKDWGDVPLGKHTMIMEALLNPETDQLQKAVEVMTALSGDDYMQFPAFKAFNDFAEHEFLQKPTPSKLILKCKIDGVTYVGQDRIDALNAAQLIDVWHVPNPDDYKNWADLLAVIYLPAGEKYDGRDNPKRAALFREFMPCTVAYGYSVFFCRYWNRLESSIRIFSARMNKLTSSQNNGVGSRLLKRFAIRT